MPDPMSRKLFMSRNAREKLRGMGGIMASSPELASTVQKFQAGGPIGATELQVPSSSSGRSTMIGGTVYTLLPNGLVVDARTGDPVAREEALAVHRKLQVFPEFDPIQVGSGVNPSFAYDERMRDLAIGFVPERLPAYEADSLTDLSIPGTDAPLSIASSPKRAQSELRPDTGAVDEFSGLLPYMTEPSGTVDIPQAGQGIFPGDIAYDLGEAVGFGPALKKAGVEDPAAERAAAQEAETAPEIIEQEVTEDPVVEPEAEDVVDRLQETRERAAEVLEQQTGDNGGGGADTFDFDTTYEQMLDRVGRVMGEGTDKGSREKAMANLAMIGLAIAAGQSPNALTNIAQGALSGMQAITAQKAREADLARESRLTALEMAEKEADRASRERIAGIRAAKEGSTYADPNRTYAISYATALTNALAGDALDIMEGETPTAYADRIARESLSYQRELLGGSEGGSTVPTTAVTPEQAQQIRNRISAAEGDANQLASIRQSLTLRGINPADYGL